MGCVQAAFAEPPEQLPPYFLALSNQYLEKLIFYCRSDPDGLFRLTKWKLLEFTGTEKLTDVSSLFAFYECEDAQATLSSLHVCAALVMLNQKLYMRQKVRNLLSIVDWSNTGKRVSGTDLLMCFQLVTQAMILTFDRATVDQMSEADLEKLVVEALNENGVDDKSGKDDVEEMNVTTAKGERYADVDKLVNWAMTHKHVKQCLVNLTPIEQDAMTKHKIENAKRNIGSPYSIKESLHSNKDSPHSNISKAESVTGNTGAKRVPSAKDDKSGAKQGDLFDSLLDDEMAQSANPLEEMRTPINLLAKDGEIENVLNKETTDGYLPLRQQLDLLRGNLEAILQESRVIAGMSTDQAACSGFSGILNSRATNAGGSNNYLTPIGSTGTNAVDDCLRLYCSVTGQKMEDMMPPTSKGRFSLAPQASRMTISGLDRDCFAESTGPPPHPSTSTILKRETFLKRILTAGLVIMNGTTEEICSDMKQKKSIDAATIYKEYKTSLQLQALLEAEEEVDVLNDAHFSCSGPFAHFLNLYHTEDLLKEKLNDLQASTHTTNIEALQSGMKSAHGSVVSFGGGGSSMLKGVRHAQKFEADSFLGAMVNSLSRVTNMCDVNVPAALGMTMKMLRFGGEKGLHDVLSGEQTNAGGSDASEEIEMSDDGFREFLVHRRLSVMGLHKYDCSSYLQLYYNRHFLSSPESVAFLQRTGEQIEGKDTSSSGLSSASSGDQMELPPLKVALPCIMQQLVQTHVENYEFFFATRQLAKTRLDCPTTVLPSEFWYLQDYFKMRCMYTRGRELVPIEEVQPPPPPPRMTSHIDIDADTIPRSCDGSSRASVLPPVADNIATQMKTQRLVESELHSTSSTATPNRNPHLFLDVLARGSGCWDNVYGQTVQIEKLPPGVIMPLLQTHIYGYFLHQQRCDAFQNYFKLKVTRAFLKSLANKWPVYENDPEDDAESCDKRGGSKKRPRTSSSSSDGGKPNHSGSSYNSSALTSEGETEESEGVAVRCDSFMCALHVELALIQAKHLGNNVEAARRRRELHAWAFLYEWFRTAGEEKDRDEMKLLSEHYGKFDPAFTYDVEAFDGAEGDTGDADQNENMEKTIPLGAQKFGKRAEGQPEGKRSLPNLKIPDKILHQKIRAMKKLVFKDGGYQIRPRDDGMCFGDRTDQMWFAAREAVDDLVNEDETLTVAEKTTIVAEVRRYIHQTLGLTIPGGEEFPVMGGVPQGVLGAPNRNIGEFLANPTKPYSKICHFEVNDLAEVLVEIDKIVDLYFRNQYNLGPKNTVASSGRRQSSDDCADITTKRVSTAERFMSGGSTASVAIGRMGNELSKGLRAQPSTDAFRSVANRDGFGDDDNMKSMFGADKPLFGGERKMKDPSKTLIICIQAAYTQKMEEYISSTVFTKSSNLNSHFITRANTKAQQKQFASSKRVNATAFPGRKALLGFRGPGVIKDDDREEARDPLLGIDVDPLVEILPETLGRYTAIEFYRLMHNMGVDIGKDVQPKIASASSSDIHATRLHLAARLATVRSLQYYAERRFSRLLLTGMRTYTVPETVRLRRVWNQIASILEDIYDIFRHASVESGGEPALVPDSIRTVETWQDNLEFPPYFGIEKSFTSLAAISWNLLGVLTGPTEKTSEKTSAEGLDMHLHQSEILTIPDKNMPEIFPKIIYLFLEAKYQRSVYMGKVAIKARLQSSFYKLCLKHISRQHSMLQCQRQFHTGVRVCLHQMLQFQPSLIAKHLNLDDVKVLEEEVEFKISEQTRMIEEDFAESFDAERKGNYQEDARTNLARLRGLQLSLFYLKMLMEGHKVREANMLHSKFELSFRTTLSG